MQMPCGWNRRRIVSVAVAVSVFGTVSVEAAAKLKVVTTTTNLAVAARGVAGDLADVESLLTGSEDPHFVDASPSYVLKAANADVVCLVGLDLEVGWLPKVLTKSGNAKVQPGAKGYCDASKTVDALDKPAGAVDRSMGDMHAAGNSHYDLSPLRLADAARSIRAALTEADPANAAKYAANLEVFTKEMRALHSAVKAKLALAVPRPEDSPFLEYHREFTYFFRDYGLNARGALEETPGVPPSAGRIAEVALSAKAGGVKAALGTPHSPRKVLDRFTELSGIAAVQLPTFVNARGEPATYAALQNRIADGIATAVKGK